MSGTTRDFFRAVVQDATAAVVVVDLDGRVRYANAEARRLTGLAIDTDVPFSRLFPGAAADRVVAFVETVASRTPGRSAYLRPTPVRWDGRLRWVDLSARALRDLAGFRGVVVTLRDVTDFHDR